MILRTTGILTLTAWLVTACQAPSPTSVVAGADAEHPFLGLCESSVADPAATAPDAAAAAVTVRAMLAAVDESTCAAADAKLQALDQLALTEVVDLRPLAGYVNLRTLYLNGTAATDLSPVSTLTGLENLYVTGVPAIGTGTRLALTSLAFVAPLTHLKWLDASSNQISDLSPLAGLAELDMLSLTDNQITSVAPLAGLAHLTHLELSNNEVTDITPLASLTALRVLIMDDNGVTSLDALAALPALYSINLRNNAVAAQGALASMPALRYVDLRANKLTSLDLTGTAELRTLVLDGNPLTKVTLTSLPKLRFVTFKSTKLTDLSGLTDLPELTMGFFTGMPLGTTVPKTAANCPTAASTPAAVREFCKS